MINLEDLEKKINSELTTKINSTEIKHNQLYIETDKDDLIDVTLFIKTNQDTKFRFKFLIFFVITIYFFFNIFRSFPRTFVIKISIILF